MAEGGSPSRRHVIAGGFCLCCGPALARRASAGVSPGPTRLVEVAPGIHIRRGVTEDAGPGNDDAIANIGCVIGRDAVAVIDPGGSLADGKSLHLAIRRLTSLPIRYVVMTHVHPDHIFGAAAFLADRPVFVGHARLPEALDARGDYYRHGLEAILGAAQAGDIVRPTLLVADRATLDLGGRTLDLEAHGPAHTDADLSLFDRRSGVLLAGDLLFVGRVPSLDGDLKGWLAALAALRARGIRRAVPGHGPALVAFPASADDLTRYLGVVLSETRAAIAAGVPIERARETVARSERTKWQLFDAYNGRNVIEAYRQLEWE